MTKKKEEKYRIDVYDQEDGENIRLEYIKNKECISLMPIPIKAAINIAHFIIKNYEKL
jgi:hypothetical protein